MALLRFGLVSLLTLVAAFAVAIGGGSLLYHGLRLDRRLDTGSLPSDAFFGVSGASAAVYGRASLASVRPQVIMIGASNLLRVPAPAVAGAAPGFTVNNMSVSGTGPAAFSRLVDLAYEFLPARSRGRHTFVLGLWYGEFTRADAGGMRALDQELTRYGFYRKDAGGNMERRVPEWLLPFGLAAVRPFILEQRAWGSLSHLAGNVADWLLTGDAGAKTIDILARDKVQLDAAQQRALLVKERAATNNALDPGTFATLVDIARRVSAAGDRLVIVDLPIPSWHADGVPAFAVYQRAKWPFIASAVAMPGISYFNMQSGVPDDDFYDSTHPKPKAGNAWGARLGRHLAGLPPRREATTGIVRSPGRA